MTVETQPLASGVYARPLAPGIFHGRCMQSQTRDLQGFVKVPKACSRTSESKAALASVRMLSGTGLQAVAMEIVCGESSVR